MREEQRRKLLMERKTAELIKICTCNGETVELRNACSCLSHGRINEPQTQKRIKLYELGNKALFTLPRWNASDPQSFINMHFVHQPQDLYASFQRPQRCLRCTIMHGGVSTVRRY